MIENVFCDFIHILTYVIMCEWILALPRKEYKHWFGKLLGLIVAEVMVWHLLYQYCNVPAFRSYITMFVYIGLIVVIYILFYTEEKKKVLFHGVWSICIVNAVKHILMIIVKSDCEVRAIAINTDLQIFLTETITMGCFLVMGLLMRKNHKNGMKDLGVAYYIGYVILAFGNFLTVSYFCDFIKNEVTGKEQKSLMVIFIIVTGGMLLQMAMGIFLILSRNVHKENEKLAAKYLNEQKNYYEYLEERERKTKKIRHDLANHLYVMQTLSLNKQRDELEEYLNIINGEIEALGDVISVNNGIVDAILNKSLNEARRFGIKLEVTGHFPLECKSSAYDLCTIFSNLLSNALEAEKQCGCGIIKVSCGYTKEQIAICVENQLKEVVEKKNGKLQTTKADKMNHGFGLENVEECVKRNGGEILMEQEGDLFRVMIFLDN